MAGEIEIIDEVIAQHKILRANLLDVRNSLTDFDALFRLQKAQAAWAQSSVNKLQDQKRQFQDTLTRVQRGVEGHFTWEERVLQPLFGEAFMKALLFVHNQIRQQIKQTIAVADSASVEGLSQEDILEQKSRLEDATSRTNTMLEEHAGLEEQMLMMLKRTFEGEAKSTGAKQTT